MKKLLLLALFVLAGCGPSQEAIQQAIAQTQAAIPTATTIPTATQIPFSALDLEAILIQDNDLPIGYSGGQVSSTLGAMFTGVPKADYSITQQIAKGNELQGFVTVIVYENMDDLETAYNRILSGMDNANPLSGSWEKGEIMFVAIGTLESFDLVFKKCNSVAHIRMSGSDDPRYITAYADRLAGRLAEFVCR